MIQQLSLAELIRFTSPLCNSDSPNEEEFFCFAWVAIHSRWIIINVDAEAKCNCKSRKQKELLHRYHRAQQHVGATAVHMLVHMMMMT